VTAGQGTRQLDVGNERVDGVWSVVLFFVSALLLVYTAFAPSRIMFLVHTKHTPVGACPSFLLCSSVCAHTGAVLLAVCAIWGSWALSPGVGDCVSRSVCPGFGAGSCCASRCTTPCCHSTLR